MLCRADPLHSDFSHDADRTGVLGKCNGHDTLDAESEAEGDRGGGGFARVALSPQRRVEKIGDLDLVAILQPPETAVTDRSAARTTG